MAKVQKKDLLAEEFFSDFERFIAERRKGTAMPISWDTKLAQYIVKKLNNRYGDREFRLVINYKKRVEAEKW